MALTLMGFGVLALVVLGLPFNVRTGPHERLHAEVVSVQAVQSRYGRNLEEATIRLPSGAVVLATVRPEHSPAKRGAVVPVSIYRRLITRNVSYVVEGERTGAES
jgi:hypothetical protein